MKRAARPLRPITWPDPAGEIKPLPRWTILPGDPAPLRHWLTAKQREDRQQ